MRTAIAPSCPSHVQLAIYVMGNLGQAIAPNNDRRRLQTLGFNLTKDTDIRALTTLFAEAIPANVTDAMIDVGIWV